MITYIRKRKYYIFIFIVLNLIISSYKEISRAITINDRATRVNCNLDKINENLANANEYLSEFELKKLKLRKVKKDFFINLEEDEAITLIEEFFNINNLNLFDIYLRKDENISSTYNCWYISGEFCGTFEEIMNLLSTLRNYEKNIIINKIDLEKLEKDLIQGSINLCLGNIKEEKGITIIPQITYLPIEINNNPFNRIVEDKVIIPKKITFPYLKYGPNLLNRGNTIESKLIIQRDSLNIDYNVYGSGSSKLILFFDKDILIPKKTKILRCEIVGIEDGSVLCEMIIKDDERYIHKIIPTKTENSYWFDLSEIKTISVLQRLEFLIKTKKHGSICIKSMYMSEEK
ncbi:MAG: hypothetical protein N4A57_18070 [Anaeromicrobium sp.]|jgi:hypothetical protein|uniref:hypothetical protein n=1 Tax=Anaeromicrobium sp. TaxID=1929132 RepID=UPI0025D089CE|nr:hypothetical protein [Anaeromicrobium sp.]MCT4596157.1 hypothetical protein [Anaeromicrobium sp.]